MLNLLDFFHFLLKPDQVRLPIQGNKALLSTLIFFIFLLPLPFLLSLPANLWTEPEKILVDMLADTLSSPSLFSVFFVVMIGPVWEEIIFRYALKFTPGRILVSVLFLFAYLGLEIWSFIPSDTLPGGTEFWLPLALMINSGLAYGLSFLIMRLFPFVEWHKAASVQRPGLWGAYMHLLAFSFAQMHLFNYQILSPEGWLLAFCLNLPRWFLGLGLSYVRVRLGLIWAMVLHITNNGFSLLLFRFLVSQG